MIADDDPILSPLWIGRRAPFHAFQEALGRFAGAYDLRNGRSDDPMSRVSVSVDDWHGQAIVPGRRIPLAAFEDLLFGVEELRDRRHAENELSGWRDQGSADFRMAVRDRWAARGADMDAFRAELRDQYADAARRIPQPDRTDLA